MFEDPTTRKQDFGVILIRSRLQIHRVPRIDHRHAESFEVSSICSDCGSTRLCDAGNQGIAQVHDAAGPLAVGGELSSRHRGHRVESER